MKLISPRGALDLLRSFAKLAEDAQGLRHFEDILFSHDWVCEVEGGSAPRLARTCRGFGRVLGHQGVLELRRRQPLVQHLNKSGHPLLKRVTRMHLCDMTSCDTCLKTGPKARAHLQVLLRCDRLAVGSQSFKAFHGKRNLDKK